MEFVSWLGAEIQPKSERRPGERHGQGPTRKWGCALSGGENRSWVAKGPGLGLMTGTAQEPNALWLVLIHSSGPDSQVEGSQGAVHRQGVGHISCQHGSCGRCASWSLEGTLKEGVASAAKAQGLRRMAFEMTADAGTVQRSATQRTGTWAYCRTEG